MGSFAHLWKADKLSDVDVAIKVDGSADDILVIPAHQAILSASPYFWAQIERWPADAVNTSATDTAVDSTDTARPCKRARNSSRRPSNAEEPQRPRLQLVLNSQDSVCESDQAAAAESVLAAMYHPTSSSDQTVLDQLTDTQLLQAAIIADMVQLDSTSTQAAGLLAKSTDLTTAVKQQYMSLPAWPQHLLPLFPAMAAGQPLLEVVNTWVKHCASEADGSPLQGPSLDPTQLLQLPLASDMQNVLLQQLGELDCVWRDSQLSQLLLQLPLPAVLLLLSSQKLKVSSEDNVLFTAQAWLDKQSLPEQAAGAAAQQLALCINGLQLSKLWLSAIALSPDVSEESSQRAEQTRKNLLLRLLAPDVKQYLSLTLLFDFTPQQVKGLSPELRDACPHWFLPPRQYTPLPAGGVELQWSLPVSELRAACIKAYTDGECQTLESTMVTPPCKGVCCQLRLDAQRASRGTMLSVLVDPINVPIGIYFNFKFSVSTGTAGIERTQTSGITQSMCVHEVYDVFELCPMAGGWDDAAWANDGLPTGGDLVLKLKLIEVRP